MTKNKSIIAGIFIAIILLILNLIYTHKSYIKLRKITTSSKRYYDNLEAQIKLNQSIIIQTLSEEKIRLLVDTDQNIVDDLYQMLKDTHEILEQHGIIYIMDAGTLLGATRHKGMIAWDDDADISIFENDLDKLKSLAPIFKNLGYHFSLAPESQYLYRISKINNPLFNETTTYPYIDISLLKKDTSTGKIRYKDDGTFNIWPASYTETELFPLKKYKFGTIELYGPNESKKYLKQLYNNNVLNKIAIYPKHQNTKYTTPIYQEKSDILLKPTLPSKPLLDRVSKED